MPLQMGTDGPQICLSATTPRVATSSLQLISAMEQLDECDASLSQVGGAALWVDWASNELTLSFGVVATTSCELTMTWLNSRLSVQT